MCNKPNHFTKVFKTKLPQDMHFVQESSSDEEFYVGCIETVNAVDMSEWYEEIMIHEWSNFSWIQEHVAM